MICCVSCMHHLTNACACCRCIKESACRSHLIAVHMSCPLVADKALVNSILSFYCDINQHLIHSAALAHAKALQHCQNLLASLPAFVTLLVDLPVHTFLQHAAAYARQSSCLYGVRSSPLTRTSSGHFCLASTVPISLVTPRRRAG